MPSVKQNLVDARSLIKLPRWTRRGWQVITLYGPCLFLIRNTRPLSDYLFVPYTILIVVVGLLTIRHLHRKRTVTIQIPMDVYKELEQISEAETIKALLRRQAEHDRNKRK